VALIGNDANRAAPNSHRAGAGGSADGVGGSGIVITPQDRHSYT
jgi:hypothetical protein